MSMLTITSAESFLSRADASRSFAPTLGNAISRIGVRQSDVVARPSVSVATFHSFPNLCQCIEILDKGFDRHLGVVIELPVHFDPQWNRLSRLVNPGGQLTIVAAGRAQVTLPMLTRESHLLQIAGWDVAQRCATIDQAIERLLNADDGIKRCFVLRAEWQDPDPIFQAIGRHLAD